MLDDSITIGAAGQREFRLKCDVMSRVWDALGLPLAAEKCKGPTQRLVNLGIVMDMIKMKLCLPKEKVSWLHHLINRWIQKWPWASVKKLDLASLAGHLQYACIIVRTFLYQILDI